MDIKSLPEIIFCETDAAAIESELITTYETIAGVSLAKGDPVRIYLEALAYIVVQQRLLIDLTGKMNLLAYATGDYLDHLGALVDTDRLQSVQATTTLRFSLAVPLAWAVTIPAGTRVTPDGVVMVTTSDPAEIAAGAVYVEVRAVCSAAGAAGNGYVAGQINRMVDLIPYVVSAVNTTTSLGGADTETDDNYRLRIQAAPESFSVAGPHDAYVYWAKTASQNIADVAVYSPSGGTVRVYPLMAGGVLPGAEDIAAVDAILAGEKVRPMCDKVEVLSPEMVPYALEVVYYISRADAAFAVQIQAAVEKAVDNFRLWQRGRLGRDLNPSKLTAAIYGAGAKRVSVVSPAAQPLMLWQVAQEDSVTISYGGLEDE